MKGGVVVDMVTMSRLNKGNVYLQGLRRHHGFRFLDRCLCFAERLCNGLQSWRRTSLLHPISHARC